MYPPPHPPVTLYRGPRLCYSGCFSTKSHATFWTRPRRRRRARSPILPSMGIITYGLVSVLYSISYCISSMQKIVEEFIKKYGEMSQFINPYTLCAGSGVNIIETRYRCRFKKLCHLAPVRCIPNWYHDMSLDCIGSGMGVLNLKDLQAINGNP